MISTRSLIAGAAALAVVVAQPVNAQVIEFDNSSPVSIPGLTSFVTPFSAVSGMEVEWFGANAGTDTWGDLGGGLFGVNTEFFKLWATGSDDTYTGAWNLWAMDLTAFSLNAIPGMAVFDVISSPETTEGSSSGRAFNWAGSGPDSRVTYSNPVGIEPDAPLGDLYGMLTVEFGEYDTRFSCPPGYRKSSVRSGQCYSFDGGLHYVTGKTTTVWDSGTFGTHWRCTPNRSVYNWRNDKCRTSYLQDMDNIDRTPDTPQETVPEPATMTLLATGLAGMAGARRRRKNNK